jgi:hypothetical protein
VDKQAEDLSVEIIIANVAKALTHSVVGKSDDFVKGYSRASLDVIDVIEEFKKKVDADGKS